MIEGRSSKLQRSLLTTTTTRNEVRVWWGCQSIAHGQAQEELQGVAQTNRKNRSADGGGEIVPQKLETGLAVQGPNNTKAPAAAGKAAAATLDLISKKQLKQHSNARKNELRACKPWSHLFATVEDHSNSKANETPVGFQEKP